MVDVGKLIRLDRDVLVERRAAAAVLPAFLRLVWARRPVGHEISATDADKICIFLRPLSAALEARIIATRDQEGLALCGHLLIDRIFAVEVAAPAPGVADLLAGVVGG